MRLSPSVGDILTFVRVFGEALVFTTKVALVTVVAVDMVRRHLFPALLTVFVDRRKPRCD